MQGALPLLLFTVEKNFLLFYVVSKRALRSRSWENKMGLISTMVARSR